MNAERPGFVSLLKRFWYIAALLALGAGGLVIYLVSQDMSMEQLLRKYGYYVILGWTFLEGETIVILAGMTARKTGLEPALIAVCAFIGSFCSDQLMFSLGKYKGRSVLHYFPRIERNMDKAAGLFKKYDIALILGFRFVYGVRNVTPIMLGISGVSHKKFFFLNFIGAAVWACSFSYGGLLAGDLFMAVMYHVGHGILYVILAAIALAALIWFLRSRRAVKHVKEVAAQGQHARQADSAAVDKPDGPTEGKE